MKLKIKIKNTTKEREMTVETIIERILLCTCVYLQRNGRARVARTLTNFTIDRFLRAEMSSREDRTIFEQKINGFRCTIKDGRTLVHLFQ